MTHPLLAWIERRFPLAHETLRPPADAAAIEEARLPEALAELYRAHDGQRPGRMKSAFFAEAFRWLPLADGHEERRRMISVMEGVREEFPEAQPFDPAWFPFAADDLGNLMVVDTATDDAFTYLHDEGRGDGPSTPSEELLGTYLEHLESGVLVIDEELGVVDRARPAPAPAARPYVVPPRTKWLTIAAIVLGGLALVAWIFWLEQSR